MDNMEAIPYGNSQAVAVREFSRDELTIIKDVVARGVSDSELKMFVAMAQKLGLDPLSRQIHCVKRNARLPDGSYGGVMTITVGIDGYRLIADRTGRYCPGKASSYEYDGENRLVSSTSYVLKLVGGTWHEVGASAYWDEYVQTTREGVPTAMWAKMPRVMLAKCAEALALRRAFPAELSGVYTEEEMQQSANEIPVVHSVPPATNAEVETGYSHDRDSKYSYEPAKEPAPKQKPKTGNVSDAAWKVEVTALGKKAAQIVKDVPDLPAEQRQSLDSAMQNARDVLILGNSSSFNERVAAIDNLKKAIGIQ